MSYTKKIFSVTSMDSLLYSTCTLATPKRALKRRKLKAVQSFQIRVPHLRPKMMWQIKRRRASLKPRKISLHKFSNSKWCNNKVKRKQGLTDGLLSRRFWLINLRILCIRSLKKKSSPSYLIQSHHHHRQKNSSGTREWLSQVGLRWSRKLLSPKTLSSVWMIKTKTFRKHWVGIPPQKNKRQFRVT